MHPLLEEWTSSVVDADLVINADDALDEAQANLWWFAVTRHKAADLTVDDVARFMRALTDLRRAQAAAAGAPALVLCWWHEPAAAQLRCSVSSNGDGLPVAGPHRVVDDPAEVAADWLAAPDITGLPLTDVLDAPNGAAAWETADEPVPSPATWVVSLP